MNKKHIIIGIVFIAIILSMSVLGLKILNKKVNDNKIKNQSHKVELKNKMEEVEIEENKTVNESLEEASLNDDTNKYAYSFPNWIEKDKDFEAFEKKHLDCLNIYCSNTKEYNKIKNKTSDKTILSKIEEYNENIPYVIKDYYNDDNPKFVYVGSNSKYTSVIYISEYKNKSYLIDNSTKNVLLKYEIGKDESISVYDFYKDFIILYTIPFSSELQYVTGVYTSDLKEIISNTNEKRVFNGYGSGIYFYENNAYILINNKLSVYNSKGEKKYNISKRVLSFNKDNIVYYENRYIYISDYKISKNMQVGRFSDELPYLSLVKFDKNKLIIESIDIQFEKNEENYNKYCDLEYSFNDVDLDSFNFGYRYIFTLDKGYLEKSVDCFANVE